MDLKEKYKEINLEIDLNKLVEIAKESAMIGSDILKRNYKNIQSISSKGRKGDLVTNVDLEVEKKITNFLLDKTPDISILFLQRNQEDLINPMN